MLDAPAERTYLLDPPAHFEIHKWPDGNLTIHRSPWAHLVQGATTTWSAEEALCLARGIFAILKGPFDRAVSEEYLATEANRNKLYSGGMVQPAHKPSLGDL